MLAVWEIHKKSVKVGGRYRVSLIRALGVDLGSILVGFLILGGPKAEDRAVTKPH